MLVGQRVEVTTRSGTVPGVVGRKPIHLLESEERKKAVELKQLHVDIGAADAEEARALVSEGDQIVVAGQPVELRGGRVASRSLDNRLGVYVALEVARRVHEAGGGGGPVAARGRRPGGDRRLRGRGPWPTACGPTWRWSST